MEANVSVGVMASCVACGDSTLYSQAMSGFEYPGLYSVELVCSVVFTVWSPNTVFERGYLGAYKNYVVCMCVHTGARIPVCVSVTADCTLNTLSSHANPEFWRHFHSVHDAVS